MKTNKINDSTVIANNTQHKSFWKSFLKLFLVPSIIFAGFLFLFIFFTVIKVQADAHFITPYQDSVSKQEGDLYVVSTYYDKNEISLEFVQTLNKLEDNYNIPYYLIDVVEYSEIIDVWDIKYWPTYFVFEKKAGAEDAQLLYKSYGNKEPYALYKEITYVQKYGMPINNLGKSFAVKENDKELFTLTPMKVLKDSENENRFTITFSVENKSSAPITINYSDFSVKSNGWTTTDSGYTFELRENKAITIEASKTSEVVLTFEGSLPYNQIDITYTYTGAEEGDVQQKIWTYKMWPTDSES